MNAVFSGGTILTMDPARPRASALVVVGDRIHDVGDPEIAHAHVGAEVVDLHGRTLLPGFIDAHCHLSLAGLQPLWCDVTDCPDLDDLKARLRVFATAHPEDEWIRAYGWDEATHGVLLDAGTLDAIGLDRPIIVTHYSLHKAVVCSRALDSLAIGSNTRDPPGGLIERDPGGDPTGQLVERAWSTAHARSLLASHDPDRWEDLFEGRARSMLRQGVTALHDAAVSPQAAAVYRRLAASGRLPVSVLMLPHPVDFLANAPQPTDAAPTGEGDEWLRTGPCKFFADGGVAFAVDVHAGGTRISFGTAFDDLGAAIAKATDRGFRVAVHAQGNVGVQRAIEAFRSATRAHPDDDHRFRVEHVTLASREQIRDLRDVGAVGVVQPAFVDHMGRALGGLVPDDATWLPFADLRAAGVPIAASSDDPCAPWEPLLTSAFGTTRCTSTGDDFGPDQAVAYEDWLAAWTAGAAYAGGQEHERGRLAPGLRADLVILEGDLDPPRPPTVAETWVAGQRVHRLADEP